jgi:hypothetical protein
LPQNRARPPASLKEEFRAALTAGTDLERLVELVDQHFVQGMPRREIARILYELWLELGFEDAQRPDSVQESLEYVLQKLSDDCPFTG